MTKQKVTKADELADLRAENKRLSERDCNATIFLLAPTDDKPFALEKLRVVDVGVADNNYIVESYTLSDLRAENERLKRELSVLQPSTPKPLDRETCSMYDHIDKTNEILDYLNHLNERAD